MQLLIDLQHEEISSLTIDDLARIAQKSRSTIYEYFESKEEVLTKICELKVKELSYLLESINTDAPGSVQKFEKFIVTFSKGISDISIGFLHGIHDHYPEAWSVINSFTDSFIEILRKEYVNGMDNGLYRRISLDLLIQLDKFFVTEIVTNKEIFTHSKYQLSDLAIDYLNLRLRGLAL